MKTVASGELYSHVSEFLKKKGIELQEGSYTDRIRRGCALLTKTINTTQEAVGKARTKVGSGLERVRQVIHEKTAPRQPQPSTGPAPSPASAEAPAAAPVEPPSAPAAAAGPTAPVAPATAAPEPAQTTPAPPAATPKPAKKAGTKKPSRRPAPQAASRRAKRGGKKTG